MYVDRRAFTILELVIATLIFLVIMGATMAVFFGASRDHEDLRLDLELNEKASKAFDMIGAAVREASAVVRPPLIARDQSPPAFRHRTTTESTGYLELITEKPVVNARASGLEAVGERSVWWLDQPKTIGTGPDGTPLVSWTLFAKHVGPSAAREPAIVMTGIRELIFWRTLRDPNAPGETGDGPAVLHVLMRLDSPRARPDKKLGAGYRTELATSFTVRGKLVGSGRTGGPP